MQHSCSFSTRSFSLGLLTWLPRHILHCNNVVLRTTLFNKQSTNGSREENSIGLFNATNPPTTMRNSICFARPPTQNQGSSVARSLLENTCFSINAQVSFPLAVYGFLVRRTTADKTREHVHQPRRLTCEPVPDAHVGIQDQTVHHLKLRAQCAHLTRRVSNRGFHSTITLKRMCSCCSRPRRLLPKVGHFLLQLPYRCLVMSLHDHRFRKQTYLFASRDEMECAEIRRWHSNSTFVLR